MTGKKEVEKLTTYMGVNMPSGLAKNVKIEAIKDGVTIQAWITRLVERELSRRNVNS